MLIFGWVLLDVHEMAKYREVLYRAALKTTFARTHSVQRRLDRSVRGIMVQISFCVI